MGKEEDCNSQRVIDSMKCMESIENDHCEGVGGFDSHEQQQEDDKQQQDEKHQLELSGASESEDIEDDLKYPGPLASFLIFLSIALAIFICGFVRPYTAAALHKPTSQATTNLLSFRTQTA